jgi:hypothetical protein
MRSESVEILPHKDAVRLVVLDGDRRTVASILLDQDEAHALLADLDTARRLARAYRNAA